MNNSRFSVYRGDFRKFIKACEFTHVGVFMRTRRADLRLAAYRYVDRKRRCIRPCVCRLCMFWDHYTSNLPSLSLFTLTFFCSCLFTTIHGDPVYCRLINVNWLVIFYFMNEKPQFLLYPREAMGLLY